MKQILLLVSFFIIKGYCLGQKPVERLILAEKNFAAYSVTHSTKEAFLKFLDTAGVVFDNGKPVNGIEIWNKREKRPGVLNWRPQYAEISESGDFGYTTGPWTFQAATIQDAVVARGEYTTVWHKDEKGDWKFLVDLGVNNTPAAGYKEVSKIERKNTGNKPGTENSMLEAEEEFIKSVDKPYRGVYKKDISTFFCLLKRNNAEPASFQDAYDSILNLMPEKIAYKINGSGIASSGDLGYVYGTTVINTKTDNYFRIWRKEKNGWKIAVEVLRF
jgi:ketosteroid isomerase-like protein